jgi:hypothetical protein
MDAAVSSRHGGYGAPKNEPRAPYDTVGLKRFETYEAAFSRWRQTSSQALLPFPLAI